MAKIMFLVPLGKVLVPERRKGQKSVKNLSSSTEKNVVINQQILILEILKSPGEYV